jgi:bifunctional UDP-N-acetylglucosamine pyrophosphorylase/glucosamine-1-phosphate N-acetyltransferase
MGAVERIVEHRDASAAERGIAEVNAGIYLISTAFARAVLQSAGTDNAQGEIYLTHVVEAAAAQGTPAVAVQVPESVEVLGVNDRVELAQLDRLLRTTRNEALMRSGVTIRFPDEVQIDADVRVGQDCVIERGVRLSGSTQLGPRCHLEEGAIVTNSVLGEGVHVKPYCVVDGSTLGNDVQVGPFAHLRPGTLLEDAVKIGNFVETKKAHMGRGSKASHLSYLGDCELGKDVNVGAGTITCNYDGVNKHQTVLEDGVFIGSDTQLVAPVRVGRGAYVGAGTTVTEDVPAGALAISRTKQTNVEGWVARKAPRKRQG